MNDTQAVQAVEQIGKLVGELYNVGGVLDIDINESSDLQCIIEMLKKRIAEQIAKNAE